MSLILDGTGTISGLNAGGLPSATVTQATLATPVAGTGPAFSAYQSSAQTISSATITKVQFQTEEFDTNNNFDSTTNYRFTPTVAGYYLANSNIQLSATATNIYVVIYKNGNSYKQGGNPSSAGASSVSGLIYLNGTTDYIEIYVYMTVGQALTASLTQTYFQASMVRTA